MEIHQLNPCLSGAPVVMRLLWSFLENLHILLASTREQKYAPDSVSSGPFGWQRNIKQLVWWFSSYSFCLLWLFTWGVNKTGLKEGQGIETPCIKQLSYVYLFFSFKAMTGGQRCYIIYFKILLSLVYCCVNFKY